MGGYAALGKARRALGRRQRKTQMTQNIMGNVGAVAAFAGGQIKKAKTAWGEYEAGYKELGGKDPITKPKLGEKGWLKSTFKGPEGKVRIGEGKEFKEYDIENIRKAGAFLGSDAASVLSDTARKDYLGRTAPGADVSAEELRKRSTTFTSRLGSNTGVKSFSFGGEGEDVSSDKSTMFVNPSTIGQSGGRIGIKHELTGADFQPKITSGERGRDAAGTISMQDTQRSELAASLSEYKAGGSGRSDFLKGRETHLQDLLKTKEDEWSTLMEERLQTYGKESISGTTGRGKDVSAENRDRLRAYSDIGERYDLDYSKDRQVPLSSSIDPTGLRGSKTEWDEFGSFEGTRSWGPADVARAKGDQFYKENPISQEIDSDVPPVNETIDERTARLNQQSSEQYSKQWEGSLGNRSLWDTKVQNNRNRRQY